MIENYCHLISERLVVVETHSKECPEELKEAISSLIFAAARCGDLPELQEMKRLFTSRYGKEFTARATELRNHCGVHPGMANKLSTRQPSLESKIKALKEIAPKSELIPQIEEAPVSTTNPKPALPHAAEIMRKDIADNHQMKQENSIPDEELSSEPLRARNKYTDVAAAAQEAFESAAYAVTAARAAIELSRSRSHHYYQDDHDTSSSESESDEKSTKLDSATNGKVAESPTTMDKQIVLYEAYEEEEVENNQELHGNIPAVLEHHNLDQESGETLNWDGLKVSSDIHSSNLEKQLHVPLSRRVRKNSH
ncbi:unnamed protein product [Linum tenue]|uniref:IST1-like protein n=1 Tax=Linum tenue TaxID=586396 RepID=A0AAV0MY12_9ROSI|nr:unnamed protein product [Linum tenue]